MQYKLYDKGNNDTSNILKEVFANRGIDDYEKYLNLDESVVAPYENLDNINEATTLFWDHYNQKNEIGILVDSDPDGYCSAAMMYLYIKRMNKDYPVDYIMHTKPKTHGLTDDITIPDTIKLLIIPDAGTNDYLECKALRDKGIDILILDHHEKEYENEYAVIVNNQMSKDYTNKNLCGAGVVYRFLQALDCENWSEYADDYLDLNALANISDVMDMRSFETRYLTDLGLLNIKNKLISALIKAQDFSMNGKVNIHNVQWYITPILNGMIRIGTLEEKELLFKAFIEQDEFFEYKKRATKDKPAEVIQESIYDRAARLCKNAKSRQDKIKDKGVAQIAELIKQQSSDEKIIMADVTDILDEGLTGVVAIKVADIFNKPCILLKKHFNKSTNEYTYGGSARNINYSPIDSLKDIVNSTGIFEGRGHANAFGLVNLPVDRLEEAKNALNDILKDIEYDSTYKVDFILDIDDINIALIMNFAKFEDIECQGIDKPMLAVENISLTRDCFDIFGKNEDTISFVINDIKYIQFKCKEGNKLYDFLQNAWSEEDSITFNIVGNPAVNEYNGVRTPQITIEDVEVIKIDDNNDNDDDEEW